VSEERRSVERYECRQNPQNSALRSASLWEETASGQAYHSPDPNPERIGAGCIITQKCVWRWRGGSGCSGSILRLIDSLSAAWYPDTRNNSLVSIALEVFAVFRLVAILAVEVG
jgi:hypothetical protein